MREHRCGRVVIWQQNRGFSCVCARFCSLSLSLSLSQVTLTRDTRTLVCLGLANLQGCSGRGQWKFSFSRGDMEGVDCSLGSPRITICHDAYHAFLFVVWARNPVTTLVFCMCARARRKVVRGRRAAKAQRVVDRLLPLVRLQPQGVRRRGPDLRSRVLRTPAHSLSLSLSLSHTYTHTHVPIPRTHAHDCVVG